MEDSLAHWTSASQSFFLALHMLFACSCLNFLFCIISPTIIMNDYDCDYGL